MWWPRPRWKNDIYTHFSLSSLIVTITVSQTAMADEGQHCAGSDMSAVVWTTAFCTMLLVLVVIAIYFVYCKKKEHDWSSLWWKNNSDKNLVLQTSAPMKGHQEQNGGTDNPAFLADINTGDGFMVVSSGLTRIVRVPSSTIDTGSLGIELSTREEGGRKIYMCKHNDGLKGRLTALRLVFDERLHRPPGGPAVNLGRALVELSHEYGLHVELETEGESAASSGAGENDGGCGTATAKPNLLSIVREKAQRLWNQRQSVFKGRADADEKDDAQTLAGMDVESGGPAIDGCGTAVPVRKSACSVSTVDETAVPVVAIQSARMGNRPVQYRTLEYNASAADVTAYASPDSAVQCCTVNSSEPPAAPVIVVQETTAAAFVSLQTAATPAAETAGMSDVAIDSDQKPEKPRMDKPINGVDKPMNGVDKPINGVDKPINGVDKPINDTDKPRTDEFINSVETQQICELGTADGAEKPTIGSKPGNNDDQKKATSNQPPPPPPPRKYSAPVISPVPVTPTNHDPVDTMAVVVTASTVTAVAPAMLSFTVPDTVAPVTAVYSVPDTRSAAAGAQHEIRMNDDYYWCTTTAMVPPMSTFGKRANNAILDVSGKTRNENAIIGSNTNVADVVVAVQHNDMDDNRVGSPDAVVGGTNSSIEDTVVGGTTSIEDASLPSFSSDDDDDDDNVEENDDIGYNGVQFTEKNKLTAHSVDDDVSRPSGSNKIGENNNNGRRKNDGDKTAMKTAECNGAPPQNRTETNAPLVAVETKLVTTKLPTLRLSLSSPSQSGVGCCTPSTLSSASSTSSTSSSPTNNNNSPVPPIVSKIPVRRQSAGSGGSTPTAVSSQITSNGTAKKSIPLPLSRSGSRLAMWTSAN